ncbi:hypothetical protein NDU88_002392 [Pleurodeles waltl]|uniref:Retrotransposon gag domain-containing protein n=1 Tax=Pleurodeles waltl TaxID=8319 RepID=A0AAV7U9M2_PLEWA|nr:hypothetical protein NDU88_002392 [Pleurodeles waltl]
MIAHMRSEALKRGKDWLRAKMVDRGDESQVHGAPAPTKQTEEMGETERSPSPSQKSNKRQKPEGKPARKSAKRPKVTLQSTDETAVPNPGASVTRAPAEGEHISAIIQECFKSLAPLLLRAKVGGAEGSVPSDRQASIQAAVREQHSTGDPSAAWGALTKVAEATPNMGSAPESYARPTLGAPSMTTRAAGLATAIPLMVKERIWRKEFIDIFTLLEIQLEGLDLTICDKKDDDRRERKRARKERNFENWLDAFRIMACVIVEKFPRSAADLWLYESKIHEAHRQFSGDAWLEYDKSFRLKMQAHPEMEWNQEDVSSYIHKMMVAREAKGNSPFGPVTIKGGMTNSKRHIGTKPGIAIEPRGTRVRKPYAGSLSQTSARGGRTANLDTPAPPVGANTRHPHVGNTSTNQTEKTKRKSSSVTPPPIKKQTN